MKTPTIEQLVEWNRKALRKLERRQQDHERDGAQFVDSGDRLVEAKPVHFPYYVMVNKREGNSPLDGYERDSILNQRPYHFGSSDKCLTPLELQIVLGSDYDYRTTTEEMNAMWQANLHCPSRDANAYLLGNFWPVNGSELGPLAKIVPVQYYRINPRRHKALGISQASLKSLVEKIEEERKK